MSTTSKRVRTVVTGLAGLAVTAAGVAAAAVPADAATAARGRVVAASGLTVRAWPATDATAYGSYPHGRVLTLTCKIRGADVDGNRWWYLVPSEGVTWVSARYVENVGRAPAECAGGTRHFRGTATVTANERSGPSTRTARLGQVAGGARVDIVCELPDGRSVDGNPSWYYLTDRRWVSATLVDVPGGATHGCFA